MATVYRNGRAYLYRSKRKNGRVTSEYRGSGEFAAFFGSLDQLEDIERREEKMIEAEAQKHLDDLEHALDDLAAESRALAHEALTAAGYHRHHRGEWRKRRV